MSSVARFVKPTEGRVIAVVGDAYRLLVTGKESGGAYALLEALVPPGGGPPPHIHSREDETFYVLEGEITFRIEGKPLTAGAASTVLAVRNAPHSFRNETDQPARMLILLTPAGFENFLLEVAAPLASMSHKPPAPAQHDIDKLLAAAPKYGVEILPS